jgi:cytochrome P450
MTTRQMSIAGIDIPADTLVWLGIGAANREATPPDVELDGQTRRHCAFGSGPHRCLGSHPARLELRLVLSAWLTTIPDFELAPGVEPRIRFPSINAGFDSLPLIWSPTAA